MTEPPTELDRKVRQAIYRSFVETGQPPAPAELAARFELSPDRLGEVLRRLETRDSAIVLLPDSSYVWMAEPFSAVPTLFPVRSGEDLWWANCIWDALAILALLKRDGVVETPSPVDGEPLRFEIRNGELLPVDAVIHFAVPACRWWESIGFT